MPAGKISGRTASIWIICPARSCWPRAFSPHVTTRDLDLGGSILTLQAVAGMAPEGISVGADIDGDGDIGLAEAIYGIQKEADLR